MMTKNKIDFCGKYLISEKLNEGYISDVEFKN